MKRLLRWMQGGKRQQAPGGGAAPVPVPSPRPATPIPPAAAPGAYTATAVTPPVQGVAAGAQAAVPGGGAVTGAAAGLPTGAPPVPAPDLQFFHWLTGLLPVDGVPLSAQEKRLLLHLDAVSVSDDERQALVPRARAIIPQLMSRLRDDSQSAQTLSEHVARDPNLVVEVLRLANSIGYRAGAPVEDLMQAIGRLGTDGLRRAIARVLLKPIFDAQADPLLGRSAERLWLHSEAKADLCQQTAAIARVEPFDAYLAGLMHNVGWTATFRALDRSRIGVPDSLSAAFVRAVAPRRDRLFALLVQSWDLSPSLCALAAEVLAGGFEGARLPLGTLLLSADRAAFLKLLRAELAAAPTLS